MGANTPTFNQSEKTEHKLIDTIITEQQYYIILTVNCVFLSTLVDLFGIVTNIINLVVFCKQGLDTSINITFFALAISDLCALLLQQAFNTFANPWLERSDVPIDALEFKYLTSCLPRTVFTRITCLITVYITMERCMCIMFPLHVKQMITPRRTALVMVGIYIITWSSVVPMYCTASVGWKFYPERNRTLLGLVFTSDNDKLTQTVSIMLTFFGFSLFAAILFFTTVLIRKLSEKSKWRMTANSDQTKTEAMSSRDKKTGLMLALIACILIACNIPTAILFSITFIVPEFSIVGHYHNLYAAMWSFAVLFETVNCSVNFILYMKMSTKYKETFYDIFLCKRKLTPPASLIF